MIVQIDSELCYCFELERPVDSQNMCIYLDAVYLGLFILRIVFPHLN